MKKIVLRAVMCLGLVLAFNVSSFAQGTLPVAKFTKDFQIVLPSTADVADKYELDITNFHFADEATAKKFFNHYRDNLISFEVKFSENKAILTLHKEYLDKKWSLAEWNKHFHNKK